MRMLYNSILEGLCKVSNYYDVIFWYDESRRQDPWLVIGIVLFPLLFHLFCSLYLIGFLKLMEGYFVLETKIKKWRPDSSLVTCTINRSPLHDLEAKRLVIAQIMSLVTLVNEIPLKKSTWFSFSQGGDIQNESRVGGRPTIFR